MLKIHTKYLRTILFLVLLAIPLFSCAENSEQTGNSRKETLFTCCLIKLGSFSHDANMDVWLHNEKARKK